MIMDNKNNACFGAPVHSEDSRSNSSSSSTSRSSAPVLDFEDPAQVINATDLEAAEQQGDEFADLQALRAGLGVLNTIAVSFALHAPPAPPIFTQHNTMKCSVYITVFRFFFAEKPASCKTAAIE